MGITSLQCHCGLLRKWWWLWSKAGPGMNGLLSILKPYCSHLYEGWSSLLHTLSSIFMFSFCSGIIPIRLQDFWKKKLPWPQLSIPVIAVCIAFLHIKQLWRGSHLHVPSGALQSTFCPSPCEMNPCEGLSTISMPTSSTGPFPSSSCSSSPPLWSSGSCCLSLPQWYGRENWFSSHFTSCSLGLLYRLFLSPHLEILQCLEAQAWPISFSIF